jgi:hypothetical protein
MMDAPERVLAILVPTLDTVFSQFTHSLSMAMAYHLAHNPNDVLIPIMHQGTLLARSRNWLAQQAIDHEADWAIWLDSDMTFPPDTFARLIESGHDVVTTNAPKRKEPIGSTAHVLNKETGRMELLDISEPSFEIVPIGTCGFAVAAMRTDVFKRVDKPWFFTPYYEAGDFIVGEDAYFASQLGKAGIKLMCDLELSEQIGHLGIKEYTLEDARIFNRILEEEK